MSLLVSCCRVVADDDVADTLTEDVTRVALLVAGAVVLVLEDISVSIVWKRVRKLKNTALIAEILIKKLNELTN